MATMAAASVAYQDGLLLHCMSALSMGGTWIDGVSVVEAPADRVAFDDLITHLDTDRGTTITVDWMDIW